MQGETSGAALENSDLGLILEFFALAENIFLIALSFISNKI